MEDTQKVKQTAQRILRGDVALPFGICRFEEVLPCLECRAKQRIPQGAASVLVCLFPYYISGAENRNISRYAMVADYHKVAGEYLRRFCDELKRQFAQNSFEPFTDNSPIREVHAAFCAGLGRKGKNGLLIHPDYGSYFFIGEVVTDLVLTPDSPLQPQECLSCLRCIKACPQGALCPDSGVMLERCRSHITQKKGELSEWEVGQIHAGGLIWGCDICNDVCPMNQNARKTTPIPEFRQSAIAYFDEEKVQTLFKDRAFEYRGKKTILRNISILKEGEKHGD